MNRRISFKYFNYFPFYLILTIMFNIAIISASGQTKQTKEEYIEELKQIALHVSVGDENLGQSIRAERLLELVDLVGADNITDILISVSKDKFPDVRMASADAMGNVTQGQQKVKDALLVNLKDSHPGVRLSAVVALNKLKSFPKDRDSVAINLAMGTSSKDWSLEGYIPRGEIEKARQKEINETCQNNLDKTNECLLEKVRLMIRKRAITQLSKIGTLAVKNSLTTLKRDSNPNIRNVAKEELNKITISQ